MWPWLNVQENYTLSVWTNDAADTKRHIEIVMPEILKASPPPFKAEVYALEGKLHGVAFS